MLTSTQSVVNSSTSTELMSAYQLSNSALGLLLAFIVLLLGSIGILLQVGWKNPTKHSYKKTTANSAHLERADSAREARTVSTYTTSTYVPDNEVWKEAENRWREQYLKRERGRQRKNIRFCRYCGVEISGPNSYCEECGRRQSKSAMQWFA